jgi:PTH1 family peptidyl-tRNA hydrolase
MSEQYSLFVFLGNPGRQYENTRHNAAWLLLDLLDGHLSLDWSLKFKGRYAKKQIPGTPPEFLYRPHTFMNKSGEGSGEIARFFSVPAERILVFHDELDLTPGEWKISRGGGTKGHNGLRSMKQHLGSNDFSRCAIGIGRPPHSGFAVNKWVLSAFDPGDRADLGRAFDGILSEVWGL